MIVFGAIAANAIIALAILCFAGSEGVAAAAGVEVDELLKALNEAA